MSDTSEDGWKQRLQGNDRGNSLREEMRTFVDEHPPRTDVKAFRSETSGGADLASLVDENREERVDRD